MNQQEIVLAVSIGVCLLAYVFGILTGRAAAGHASREQLETLRKQVFKQRRITHEVEQALTAAHAELANLRLQHRLLQARERHDHYTLLRAGHELQLASKTFASLQATEHAQTAQQLSTAVFDMANQAKPAEPAEAHEAELPNQCEEMGVAA